MEVLEFSGVVGSVIYEVSVLVGLSEDEELVGWELSRRYQSYVMRYEGKSMDESCQERKLSCLVR